MEKKMKVKFARFNNSINFRAKGEKSSINDVPTRPGFESEIEMEYKTNMLFIKHLPSGHIEAVPASNIRHMVVEK